MAPVVRQTRGPGMNRGMKKPRRKPGEPKPHTMSREMKRALEAKPSSYLPEAEGKRPRRGRRKNPLPGLL